VLQIKKAVMAAALALAVAAILPVQTSAQSRGGMHIVRRAPAAPAVRAPLVGTPLYPNFTPIPGGPAAVPGLGFDYDHLVAVDRTHLDHFGRFRRTQFITPIFFGDDLPLYDYYDTDYATQLQPQQQPGMAVLPQYREDVAEPSSSEPVNTVTSSAANTPVKDVGEFILVRLDGQVTLAVAFTTANGRLTYVTREGTRRSFPTAELDNEATRQMNDANGTTLTLSN
jgi:hypothetical protein